MTDQDTKALYDMVRTFVTKARPAVSSPAGEKMMQVRKDLVEEARALLDRLARETKKDD